MLLADYGRVNRGVHGDVQRDAGKDVEQAVEGHIDGCTEEQGGAQKSV